MKIIAGVCSAETESQLLTTAGLLKIFGIDTFRAGVWKARTRPNTFEGAGDIGLEWLKKVKELLSIKTMVEVATPTHVEKCLKSDIDILWVGARTTVSPFSMQELSEALRGVQKPIFVKNPVCPDVSLWAGAVERLARSVYDIKLIHRGFSVFPPTTYRNEPMWELASEMRKEFDYDMYLDPSHMAGVRSLVKTTITDGYTRGYDGLFIEAHHDPSKALCDKNQQLTPQELFEEIEKNEKLFQKSENDY